MSDIREQTCIIILKDGYYLQGKKWMDDGLLWTWSAYDTWRTRDREAARRVARITGGVMVLFNPVVGEKKVM